MGRLLRKVLAPVVEVSEQESVTLLLMFAYSFLAMTAYNILKPITRSQFISQLGADNIPYIPLVAAVAIGLIGNRGGESQAQAQDNFCSSLSALEGSIDDLTSLDPGSASKSDYQDAVSTIESDWDQVKSDASDLANVTMSDLDDAWDSFKSDVDDVPDDASVSDALQDVTQSAQTLASSVKSTLTGPDCS